MMLLFSEISEASDQSPTLIFIQQMCEITWVCINLTFWITFRQIMSENWVIYRSEIYSEFYQW